MLTIIWIILFVVGIALFVTGALLRNVQVIVSSLVSMVLATVVAVINGALLSAALWVVYFLAAFVIYLVYLYKGKHALYWIASGLLIGTAFSAFDYSLLSADLALILAICVPLLVTLAFAVPTAIFCPKRFKKEQKKNYLHVTTDTLVGLTFEVTEEASFDNPGRIQVNDIDWAIIPEEQGDVLKAGDRVVVKGISGVRLICVLDAEYAKECKKQAKKQAKEDKKNKKAEAKLEKEAAKAAKKEEAEAKKAEEEAKKAEVEAQKEIELARIEADKEVRLAEIQKEIELKKLELEAQKEVEEVVAEPAPEVVEEVVTEEVVEEVVAEPAPEVVEEVVTEEVVEEVAPAVEAPVDEEEDGKVVRISFINRFLTMDDVSKENYNAIKSELLSYGVKSRFSSSGESFRLHRKIYAKIAVAGKGLKVYFALDPKDYVDSPIPVKDVSAKKVYADIPASFKVKSPLSLKRCKSLIADVMTKDGLNKGDVEARDWAQETIDLINAKALEVEESADDEAEETEE